MARCPNCDAKLDVDAASCQSCNATFGDGAAWQPIPEDAAEASRLKVAPRPEAFPDSNTVRAGRLLVLLGWIILVLTPVVAALGALPLLAMGASPKLLITTFGGSFALGALYLIVGAGMKRHRPWAKYLALPLCAFSLTNVPIGTVIGAMVLFYLFRGWREQPSVA